MTRKQSKNWLDDLPRVQSGDPLYGIPVKTSPYVPPGKVFLVGPEGKPTLVMVWRPRTWRERFRRARWLLARPFVRLYRRVVRKQVWGEGR